MSGPNNNTSVEDDNCGNPNCPICGENCDDSDVYDSSWYETDENQEVDEE